MKYLMLVSPYLFMVMRIHGLEICCVKYPVNNTITVIVDACERFILVHVVRWLLLT